MLMKQSLRILVTTSALLTASSLGLIVNAAQSSNNSEPLILAEQGSFFVNGETVQTNYPNTQPDSAGRIVVNQMYVQYMVPQDEKSGAYPVVMMHGSGHTGKTYETTPDGRMGWAEYFVRQGFPVYVVDQVGRARSSFDPTLINQEVVESTSSSGLIPSEGLPRFTYERAWEVFRFGPEPDEWYPESQFPREAIDQYMAQLVPNTETTLPNSTESVDGLEALLEQIGPAIVMVHSQSGGYGLGIATRRPDLVAALIDVEGRSGCTPRTPEQTETMTQVPFLTVIGDYDYPNEPFCREAVEEINAAGGNAFHGVLPEQGFVGNSHMLMMDKNNLEIADWILTWVDENVEASSTGSQAPTEGGVTGGGMTGGGGGN